MTLICEVTMRLPDGREITFSTGAPVDFSTLCTTGAEPGQNASPVANVRPHLKVGVGDRGEVAPVAPPADAGATTSPPSTLRRKAGELGAKPKIITITELARQRAEARHVLAELSHDLSVVDRELAPSRDAEAAIKRRLTSTYDVDPNGLIWIDFVRRDERAGLYRALDDLTFQWGPKRAERARLAREVKHLENAVDQISRQIEREEKKERKRS